MTKLLIAYVVLSTCFFACKQHEQPRAENNFTSFVFEDLKTKIDSVTIYEMIGDQSFDHSKMKRLRTLFSDSFNRFKIDTDTLIKLIKHKEKLEFILAFHDSFYYLHNDLLNFKRLTLNRANPDSIFSIKLPNYLKVNGNCYLINKYDSLNYTLDRYKKHNQLISSECTHFPKSYIDSISTLEFIDVDQYIVLNIKLFRSGKIYTLLKRFEYDPNHRMIQYTIK